MPNDARPFIFVLSVCGPMVLSAGGAGAQAYVDQVTIPQHGPAYVGQVPEGARPVVQAPARKAPASRAKAPPRAAPVVANAQPLISARTAAAISPASPDRADAAGTVRGAAGSPGAAESLPSVGKGVVIAVKAASLDAALPSVGTGTAFRH